MFVLFAIIVACLVVFDLGVLSRKAEVPDFRSAFARTGLYVTVACTFGSYVALTLGAQKGAEFFTGYALEVSLSMDNVFVMSMIFTALSIPSSQRGRVLLWGILTALVLRGIFIFTGAAAVAEWRWLLLGFAAFLVYTGIWMLFGSEEEEVDIEKNAVLKFLRRYFRITGTTVGNKFFVRRSNLTREVDGLFVTPLFVALVMVEISDVIFAFDSVPAVFAITTDPLVIYTSNIFAILGLRSLYFTLEAMVGRFQYLGYALAVVLIFIGAKVVGAEVFDVHMPISMSLVVVASLILSGVAVSVVVES